jgi:hypothetical protein
MAYLEGSVDIQVAALEFQVRWNTKLGPDIISVQVVFNPVHLVTNIKRSNKTSEKKKKDSPIFSSFLLLKV